MTLTNSSLSNNTATGNGDGLANADTLSGTAPAATFTRSPVSNNTAGSNGGGIYNGQRGTLTTTGVSGSPLIITGNTATGTLLGLGAWAWWRNRRSQLHRNHPHPDPRDREPRGWAFGARGTAGGVYRLGGTMTTTSSPITANNCVGSSPAAPTCTG